MSTHYIINKRKTHNDGNHSVLGNAFVEISLEIILIYLSDFGGVNWEKYKRIREGKEVIFYDSDYFRDRLDNSWGSISFEPLIKEDYNRVVAALLKGISEFDLANDKETYITFMQTIYPGCENWEARFAWQEALDEAETKFKLDPRYDPEWRFDPNLDNDQEVLITCYDGNQ